jgi:acyl-CoA thioester hydrolase
VDDAPDVSILMHNYPVKLSLRLDWSEMDLFGHINNVSYFKYIQASRINYWEQIGLATLHGDMNLGPILASTTCKFLRPLHYPGLITVQASVEFIRNTSFGIHHQILNEHGEIAAEANDIVVLYNFNTNEKVLFPDGMRKKIESIEGRSF